MKKLLSVLLALGLVLSLAAGCGEGDSIASALRDNAASSSTADAPGENTAPNPETETAPVGRGYFENVWRADYDFEDMHFEVYDLERLEKYTDPIYEMAENGGTPEEFSDADYWLTDELYYIYSLYQLADLEWYGDPDNEELARRSADAMDVYLQAHNEFFKALHALAVSEHAGIMSSVYPNDYVQYFVTYDPDVQAQQNSIFQQETELVSEYYALMSRENVDYEAAVEVFVELVELRNTIAELSGYDSYADYAYYNLYYRDYTPQDSAGIWQGVKEHFAPLVRAYQEKVWDGTDRIMASDLDTSPKRILSVMGSVLPAIAPELDDAFYYMQQHKLYDIEHDPDKADLGFTTTLYYYNQPYIFNGAYGEFYDYMNMIHEFGHFANAYANMSDLIYGMADMDLSELQSQGMEVLFTRYYDYIFGEYADDALGYTLMSLVYSVVDGSMYDEFLQRVYSEPKLSAERVLELYCGLYTDYGYSPYPGYEYEWVDVVHNFEYPFYYISYGVSALGALEIYELMQTDWQGAVDMYMTVCGANSEIYYFSDVAESAGLADVFDPETYGKMAQSLDTALE